MTNKDYIEIYKNIPQILTDCYKIKKNGVLVDVDGIVNPIVIDNRDLMSPVDNQLDTPHCGAYSAATLVESLYWKHTGKLLQLDSHQVYALAKQLDGKIYQDGTYLEAALNAVLSLCKNNDAFSFLNTAKINTFFGTGNENTIDAVKMLIHKYDFIQAGFQIDDGWMNCTNGNYIIRKGNRSCGGHAVNVCGYDNTGFYILNQWGTKWGAKGFAILPYELFMKQFIYCAYLHNIIT